MNSREVLEELWPYLMYGFAEVVPITVPKYINPMPMLPGYRCKFCGEQTYNGVSASEIKHAKNCSFIKHMKRLAKD
jgi:hypothetical protein